MPWFKGKKGGSSSDKKSSSERSGDSDSTSDKTSQNESAGTIDTAYYVIAAFAARNEDELSFSPGECVTVLQAPEGGWWFGRLESGGREGWFPANHVTETAPVLRRATASVSTLSSPTTATRPRSAELRDTHAAALAAVAVEPPSFIALGAAAQRQQSTRSQHFPASAPGSAAGVGVVPAPAPSLSGASGSGANGAGAGSASPATHRSATPPHMVHGLVSPTSAGAPIAPPLPAAGTPVSAPPHTSTSSSSLISPTVGGRHNSSSSSASTSSGSAPTANNHATPNSTHHAAASTPSAASTSVSGAPTPTAPSIFSVISPAAPSSSSSTIAAATNSSALPQPRPSILPGELASPRQRRGTGMRYAADDAAASAAWFLGGASRDQVLQAAKYLLDHGPVGAFLVREPDSEPTCYALVVKVPSKLQNFLIRCENEAFYVTKEIACPSLSAVIAKVTSEPLLSAPILALNALDGKFYNNIMKIKGSAASASRAQSNPEGASGAHARMARPSQSTAPGSSSNADTSREPTASSSSSSGDSNFNREGSIKIDHSSPTTHAAALQPSSARPKDPIPSSSLTSSSTTVAASTSVSSSSPSSAAPAKTTMLHHSSSSALSSTSLANVHPSSSVDKSSAASTTLAANTNTNTTTTANSTHVISSSSASSSSSSHTAPLVSSLDPPPTPTSTTDPLSMSHEQMLLKKLEEEERLLREEIEREMRMIQELEGCLGSSRKTSLEESSGEVDGQPGSLVAGAALGNGHALAHGGFAHVQNSLALDVVPGASLQFSHHNHLGSLPEDVESEEERIRREVEERLRREDEEEAAAEAARRAQDEEQARLETEARRQKEEQLARDKEAEIQRKKAEDLRIIRENNQRREREEKERREREEKEKREREEGERRGKEEKERREKEERERREREELQARKEREEKEEAERLRQESEREQQRLALEKQQQQLALEKQQQQQQSNNEQKSAAASATSTTSTASTASSSSASLPSADDARPPVAQKPKVPVKTEAVERKASLPLPGDTVGDSSSASSSAGSASTLPAVVSVSANATTASSTTTTATTTTSASSAAAAAPSSVSDSPDPKRSQSVSSTARPALPAKPENLARPPRVGRAMTAGSATMTRPRPSQNADDATTSGASSAEAPVTSMTTSGAAAAPAAASLTSVSAPAVAPRSSSASNPNAATPTSTSLTRSTSSTTTTSTTTPAVAKPHVPPKPAILVKTPPPLSSTPKSLPPSAIDTVVSQLGELVLPPPPEFAESASAAGTFAPISPAAEPSSASASASKSNGVIAQNGSMAAQGGNSSASAASSTIASASTGTVSTSNHTGATAVVNAGDGAGSADGTMEEDITFVVGPQRELINGNLAALRKYSPPFEEYQPQSVVEVPLVEPAVFMLVLDFLRRGKVEIGYDNALSLWVAAAQLAIGALQRMCEDAMVRALYPANVSYFLDASVTYAISSVKDRCLSFLSSHPVQVVTSPGFLRIHKEAFAEILAFDGLGLSEEDVWSVLLAWGRYHSGLSTTDTVDANVLTQGILDAALFTETIDPAVLPEDECARMAAVVGDVIPLVRLFLMESVFFLKYVAYSGLVGSKDVEAFSCFQGQPQTYAGDLRASPRSGFAPFVSSSLLSVKQQLQLNTWCGYPGRKWQLLFRASHNGFGAAAFHAVADGLAPTLVAARAANGTVFGGMADVTWTSSGRAEGVPKSQSFLFTFRNGATLRFDCSDPQHVIHCHSGLGPVFGGKQADAADLHIATEEGARSTSQLPLSFQGPDADPCALAGAPSFVVEDYELFWYRKHADVVSC